MSNEGYVRVFKNPILESLTHVHPILPIVMWGPVALYAFYVSIVEKQLNASEFVSWFFIAFIVWTFTEYAVHRFLFHYPAKSKFGKRIIYLFHGIHHDEPDDKTRLVMPPLPAVILMSILFVIFNLIIPGRYLEVFMGFFIVGYLCYDYIHYGTHHWPMKSKAAQYVRKFHLRHHHSKEASKYGVSNPLWDYIFNTVTGPKKDTK